MTNDMLSPAPALLMGREKATSATLREDRPVRPLLARERSPSWAVAMMPVAYIMASGRE